jgi:hypothetical protein|tara:strand:+ start:728 stop:979 length:252 start_codon:yes stop_codon:yes gene_type:complete
MEEPVHYLVLLLLQFDGTLVKEILEFTRPVTLMECLDFGNVHREAVATYVFEEKGKNVNVWLLNDGSGTWQGYQCFQDPDKMK